MYNVPIEMVEIIFNSGHWQYNRDTTFSRNLPVSDMDTLTKTGSYKEEQICMLNKKVKDGTQLELYGGPYSSSFSIDSAVPTWILSQQLSSA